MATQIQEFIQSIKKQVFEVPDKAWCDFSDSWGTGAQGLIMTAYNLSDRFNLSGYDRHEAFDIISRNRKKFSEHEHFGTGCSYDCSGKVFAVGFSCHRCGDMLIFIKTQSYDI